jgi:ribonucleoside-triphosphate reductase
MDSKGIKPLEKIKKSIKNGVLSIGIVGLNECINILKIDEQQLLDFIDKKIKEIRNETKLNFMLIGPNKEVSKKFIDLDRTIYGEIKNITDKDYYDLNFDKKNIFDGGYFFELNVIDYSINDIVKLLTDYKKKEYGYLVIKKELTK